MDKLIATIPKNTTEEIRIGLDKFKGHDLVSLRVWADPYAGDERVATRKGISMNVKLLPDLIAALQDTKAAAREAGLLADHDDDDAKAA